jgi:hypothetical protein
MFATELRFWVTPNLNFHGQYADWCVTDVTRWTRGGDLHMCTAAPRLRWRLQFSQLVQLFYISIWRRQMPPRTWMSVSCECCVFSGRSLYVGLISRPEESYRVWCVWVWSWSLDNEEALAHRGLLRHWGEKIIKMQTPVITCFFLSTYSDSIPVSPL